MDKNKADLEYNFKAHIQHQMSIREPDILNVIYE